MLPMPAGGLYSIAPRMSLGNSSRFFKDLDFKPEIGELGIGRFQRGLRRQAELELRSLAVAL